ncbi:MAG: hypothetical protein COB38_03450 [Gammaproteobacteria bacterium]|nr:MAG: hypothetical protein COB38_03450 [Gammaproteobacteria bacterium]
MKLKPFMRDGMKKRRKAYGSGARASNIPNRMCITIRPKIVEEKTRIGDWECDTVIGKDRKSILVTVVDRTTLYTCCSRVFGRTAKIVSAAIIRILKPHMAKVLTLTFDNGSEFVEHEKIGRILKADTYFFPKGTDLRKVTWREVKDAVENLNNRPRKTRDYLTPNQLFNNKFVPLI